MALFYQHDRFWFVTPAIENKLTLSALLSRHRSRISNKDSITHELSPALSRKNIKKIFFFFCFCTKENVHDGKKRTDKKQKIGPKVGDGCVWVAHSSGNANSSNTQTHTHLTVDCFGWATFNVQASTLQAAAALNTLQATCGLWRRLYVSG